MYNRVKTYITQNEMIQAGDTIVVGISGGADSICLLFILLELQKEIAFDLRAAHVNHMLRPQADEDAAFVADVCRRQGVPLQSFNIPVADVAREQGISIEEAGRDCRYRSFRAMLPGQSVKIAVAHHQDDRAETILLNLFRGSGLKGLTGIRPVRDDIIRPLLCCTRREIETYLAERGLPYRNDATNDEDIHTRNRVRHHIIPRAAEVNPEAIRHMAKTAELVWEAESYLHRQTEAAYHACVTALPGRITIDIRELNTRDMFIQKRIFLLALERLSPGRSGISARHVEALLGLTISGGSREIHLSHGLTARKEYDSLVIHKTDKGQAEIRHITAGTSHANDDPAFQIDKSRCAVGLTIDIPEAGSFFFRTRRKNEDIPQKMYTKWFDYDKISSCVHLRRRKPGDFLVINNTGGHKKLREYLINEKVPKAKRDRLYVLADAAHVIWVPGLRISEHYKISDETVTILEVEFAPAIRR